jgi:hypothetical protein
MTVWVSLLTKKLEEAFPGQTKLKLTCRTRTAIQPPLSLGCLLNSQGVLVLKENFYILGRYWLDISEGSLLPGSHNLNKYQRRDPG